MPPWPWFVAALIALTAVFYLIGRRSLAQPERLRRQFIYESERLRQEFFAAASATGKPRGLRWKSIDWTDRAGATVEPLLARETETGEIVALVPVTIAFEAIEGGDMEGLAAVGNLRNATAVFFWRDGGWRTIGKAVFNLNPNEVLERFRELYKSLVS